MKVKKCIAILLIFFVVIALSPNEIFAKSGSSNLKGTIQSTNPVPTTPNAGSSATAPGISDITSGMSNVGNATTENSKIFNILNAVIKLIQVAGSGVAVIVVTMLRHKIYAGKFSRKSRYQKTSSTNRCWLCDFVCSS